MTAFSLDDAVADWRAALSRQRTISAADGDELEAHLREQVDGLHERGLTEDEAFLIAVKRLGSLDDLSREFAREHSERLWKQLTGTAPADGARGSAFAIALGFAALAAVLVKVPSLFDTADGTQVFGSGVVTVANAVTLVLAALGGYFAVVRRAPLGALLAALLGFGAVAIGMNAYPFDPQGMTVELALAHTPVALWLCVGVVFAAGAWRSTAVRMDFIRFTGEWIVYFTLIALGGGVLVALTIGLFSAIDVDVLPFVENWMLPCGAAGAVIVSAWLVEAKQAVIENIAPVLTKAFTPLFTALMVTLIVVGLVQGGLETVDRNVLILFDATLLVVLGLVLYSMSAREPLAPAGWFDRLLLILLASAIVVDLIVLIAMLTRIGAFGASANKLASLGLNVILLGNLIGALILQTRFTLGRTRFATLERWQTAYLPVYGAWALAVVLVFPPLFGYV